MQIKLKGEVIALNKVPRTSLAIGTREIHDMVNVGISISGYTSNIYSEHKDTLINLTLKLEDVQSINLNSVINISIDIE